MQLIRTSAIALLCLTSISAAQTLVTLPALKDNSMYAESGLLSNGAGTRCFAGTNFTGSIRRGLIAFDMSQIPAGSTITKVDLVLTVVMSATLNSTTVTLQAVQADWGEAASVGASGEGGGGTALTGDATWTHRLFNTSAWTTPGGDFSATVSGSTSVGTSGAHTWSSTAQMVADVQGWLDKPATNFGWVLLGDEVNSQTAKAFATHDDLTTTNHPQLLVTYTPPKASVTSVGTGCTGSGTTPLSLIASGPPVVPSATYSLTMSGGPTGQGLFALSVVLLPSPVPLGGGCNLYVNPTPLLVVFSTGALRTLPFLIPNQPSLIGETVFWQGAVGDSVTNQLVTSNALILKLGV